MTRFFAEVFERDNRRCVYCGRDLMVDFDTFMIAEEDHLVPLSENGTDEPSNIVTACAVCNRLKGSFVPSPEYVAAKRAKYIEIIRSKIMERRANKMADYATWTHPG
jgi:5-methylcytosine-specific restriction endonuclease McrA